ncbi:MAG TPA: hypothetical protein VML55_14410 [Planctomycetaceae bacterium]|nr:hypothetical protein [Planctomycetaceae bacterium]
MTRVPLLSLLCCGLVLLTTTGCGSSGGDDTAASASSSGDLADRAAPLAGSSADSEPSPGHERPAAAVPQREFQPVRLGSVDDSSSGTSTNAAKNSSSERGSELAFEALKELQIVLGEWRGTTRRKFGDFNALETVRWKWDLLTDRSQPALVLETTDSPYFQHGRLTWDADQRKFRMTATDKAGVERVYEGKYTLEPQFVPGDDPEKLERAFKLQLVQVSPSGDRELAQVVLNHQNNNRYLLELYRRSGDRVVIYDTVANQRQGTSFALIDEGYGERTCVISEGLGTMTVSHNGRTYYVCCTGCKAAFEENPEYWIAKAAERGQPQSK